MTLKVGMRKNKIGQAWAETVPQPAIAMACLTKRSFYPWSQKSVPERLSPLAQDINSYYKR